MCGIHGILAFDPGARPDSDCHRIMGDITRHRGPDDDGVHLDGPVMLGMRRLAIIDVGGGHQPIANEDGTITVVCNGEIYNFRELRQDLVKRGHRFSTGSDSEVIVHLYEEYGDDFVSRLQGMFGFALWDARRKRLLVGRDRLGIKPLYYLKNDTRLIFASEAKAILALPGVSAQIDPAALCQYLALGYTAAPDSIFSGIAKLPPASMLICENGQLTVKAYWSAADYEPAQMSESDWIDAVRTRVEEAVVAQMVSDVPLGAFLSGGIDSSGVVAMMSRHSDQPVKTYSIGFDTSSGGKFYNELPYARKVAEMFGTAHREITVRPDVAGLMPRLLWHMDEPMADAAYITTYLVAEFARRDVTVILSGVGGDELFGGYRRYLGEYYGARYNRLPRWLRTHALTPLARSLPSDRHSRLLNLSRYARSFILAHEMPFDERYRAYVQVFSPEHLDRLLATPAGDPVAALKRAFDAVPEGDPVNRLMTVDLMTQMPDDLLMLTDKMTMATSLECRVPLLDERLVDLALTMPSRMKVRGRNLKYVLKKALTGILPDDILYRPKRGFGAPMGAWLKNELATMLEVVLSRESVERRGLFRWQAVAETIAEHRAAKADNTDHLLALMNLEIWSRMYLDGRSPADVSAELNAEAVA